MSKYIDADALLNDLKEELEIDSPMLNEVENTWVNKGIRIAIKDVKHFPTADVVEVRHGYWNKRTVYPMGYNCSECNNAENYKSPFCRLCGAKMDGERREV